MSTNKVQPSGNSNMLCAIPLLLTVFLSGPIQVLAGENGQATLKTEDTLAQVAGVTLTKEDFEQRLQILPPHVQAMVRADKRIRDRFLQSWVQQTLMAREAESQGLDQIASVEIRVREYRDQLLAEELMNRRLLAVADASEEECRAYFEAHVDFFQESEQVEIAQLLFALPENAPLDVVKNAQTKAELAQQRLIKGESFEDVARYLSEDNASKHRGGYLGFFERGKLLKEFEEAAFSTPVGEVSAPVRTAMGIHLIKVLAHQPDRLPTFEEVKDKVQTWLQQEKKLAAKEKFLEELKAKFAVSLPQQQ